SISWTFWVLGYPDTAVACITASLARADSLTHPHTQAYAYYYASVLHALLGGACAPTCRALCGLVGRAWIRAVARPRQPDAGDLHASARPLVRPARSDRRSTRQPSPERLPLRRHRPLRAPRRCFAAAQSPRSRAG